MKLPLKKIIKRIRGIPSEQASPGKFFSAVYKHNLWSGKESRSGTGSEGTFAIQKIQLLKNLVAQRNIQSLLDLGCGDLYWMVEIIPALQRYHGVDVVRSVIEQNKTRFKSPDINFQCLDLSAKKDQKKLSQRSFDLIVCFDVLGHMLNEEIDSFLEFIISDLDVKYLLVTNRRDENSELYLQRPKSRHEGINVEKHPLFLKNAMTPIWQEKAEYPGDYFELYELPNG